MTKATKKTGRPSGQSTTRIKILTAARELFTKEGYDQTTIRAVAKKVEVDPALVMHYFSTKQELFIATMAPTQSMPHKIAKELANGDPETLGLRLATLFIGMLESKSSGHIVITSLKAAIRIPGAAALLKAVLVRPILNAFKDSALDNVELRATLAQSQLIGLVMARYILKIEPLASLASDELISYLAPTLQRYLTGDLMNSKKEVS